MEVYGWLAPGEMVRGLALAETTPGPLVMVVQFVAFVGAYRDPGGLDPWVAAEDVAALGIEVVALDELASTVATATAWGAPLQAWPGWPD